MAHLVLKSNWFNRSGLDDDLERKFNAVGAFVSSAASELAPKKSGNLSTSISYDVDKEGDKYITRVGTNVEYAPFVEFGTGIFSDDPGSRKTPWWYKDDSGNWYFTRGMRPQPFLFPSLVLYKSTIRKIFKAA